METQHPKDRKETENGSPGQTNHTLLLWESHQTRRDHIPQTTQTDSDYSEARANVMNKGTPYL